MPRLTSADKAILSRSITPVDEVDDRPASIPPTQTIIDKEAEAQLEHELVKTTEEKPMKKGRGSRKQKAEQKPPSESASGGEDGPEDVYNVEAVVDHRWQGKKCLYRVRWENYTEEDDTWEPEEHLLPASRTVLAEYHQQIGGIPQPPKKIPKSASKANLKDSASIADDDAESPVAKRQKRDHRSTSNIATPGSEKWKLEKIGSWQPTDKTSWEDLVHKVETVERDQEGNLNAYIRFRNGKRSKVAQNLYTSRCPRAMIRFYESHLVLAKVADLRKVVAKK